jgi:DNA-directed RNA polymerase
MRTHGHRSQHQVLKPADLSRVYAGLNSLSSVKWKINPNVLDAIQYFWNDQKGFGEIPSMHDLEIPNSANTDEAPQSFARRRSKAILENRNLHSLRMSMKYRIEVAEMFRYRHFYLPHSLDFRGRAYPLPPHLNQMGSDATRGLLLFANKQPLGTRGLFWLKVHLANLYGMDKFDFDGRVAWVDKHMELIADSAEAPVRGRRWWQAADKPFEFLAACHELVSALRSSDPTQYLSDLPVHQDGSCNGLQHYGLRQTLFKQQIFFFFFFF